MRVVLGLLSALALSALGPAAAATIEMSFVGGGDLGSAQSLATARRGFDRLNGQPIGEDIFSLVTGETRITGSLTLDTRNFVRDTGTFPRRDFAGPPPPITAMAMTADGPLFRHALATDNRNSQAVFVQWEEAGDQDYFQAYSRITLIDTQTVTESGGNGAPYRRVTHEHHEIVALEVFMRGFDGLTEIMVDGRPVPLVQGVAGCGGCSAGILESTYDKYSFFETDAAGRVVADYFYYENVLERRSDVVLAGFTSTFAETPVEVHEPATLGIAAIGLACALWAGRREKFKSSARRGDSRGEAGLKGG